MRVKKNLLLFLLMQFFVVKAQKSMSHQELYWLRYYNQISFNKKWVWHNEVENRRFFKNNSQHQLVTHTHLHYKAFPNLDMALGLTYFLQSPQDPNSTSSFIVPEIRPFQEIAYTNSFTKRFALQQRIRVEERYIHKNDGKILQDGYNFNFRFRYRLQASFKLRKDDRNPQTIVKIGDELMINGGESVVYNQFDQNRFYAALEQEINKNVSIELSYINWYQQRSAGNQFFDRDIVRLTLYHKINLD